MAVKTYYICDHGTAQIQYNIPHGALARCLQLIRAIIERERERDVQVNMKFKGLIKVKRIVCINVRYGCNVPRPVPVPII